MMPNKKQFTYKDPQQEADLQALRNLYPEYLSQKRKKKNTNKNTLKSTFSYNDKGNQVQNISEDHRNYAGNAMKILT